MFTSEKVQDILLMLKLDTALVADAILNLSGILVQRVWSRIVPLLEAPVLTYARPTLIVEHVG